MCQILKVSECDYQNFRDKIEVSKEDEQLLEWIIEYLEEDPDNRDDDILGWLISNKKYFGIYWSVRRVAKQYGLKTKRI